MKVSIKRFSFNPILRTNWKFVVLYLYNAYVSIFLNKSWYGVPFHDTFFYVIYIQRYLTFKTLIEILTLFFVEVGD